MENWTGQGIREEEEAYREAGDAGVEYRREEIRWGMIGGGRGRGNQINFSLTSNNVNFFVSVT